MRFFRDFLCFRFWQRRRGSGHREGEGHKVINWSKIILDVQLICKKPPAQYSILPHQGECSHFPDMHRRPYPLTLCLCATYVAAFVCHSASDNCLSLLCCSLCRSLCREEAGALLQLLSQKWNIAKWLPCMLHKLEKFMALLWAFHYSRVAAWLLNPCLTVWIIRKRGINAFNAYTRSKCWLLTRSEQNNEMP